MNNQSLDQETHYFDADHWEFTTEDKSLVTDGLNYKPIIRMGRLKRLPDVYVTQRYNEAADEYETKEFPTQEEAEAWRKELL